MLKKSIPLDVFCWKTVSICFWMQMLFHNFWFIPQSHSHVNKKQNNNNKNKKIKILFDTNIVKSVYHEKRSFISSQNHYPWYHDYIHFFFLSGFSFTDTDNSQQGKGGYHLPLPPAHEHSDNYLQLCTWDDYHIFLIASPVFTRLLCYSMRFTTVSNYYLIDVMLTFVLFACWFDFRFCYGDLTWETSGTRTCIDYHPCITSEPTNQVC